MPAHSKRKFLRPYDPANLRALVEKYHDGNVTEAARRLGIPQSTMHGLLQPGGHPMGETIELIARSYGVTMDWVYGRASKVQADSFAAGVLHAITVMQQTIEQLNATRDLDHLRESIDESARFLLSEPPRHEPRPAPHKLAERDTGIPVAKKRGAERKPRKRKA